MQKSLRMTQVTWRCTVFLHHRTAPYKCQKWRNAEISTTVQEGKGESAVLFIYHSISAAPHNKEGT